jgi:fatty aldehyde-generating acyl-ACP reductase
MAKVSNNLTYAFIVHSRNRTDLLKKFPFLSHVPLFLFDKLTLLLPPITVSYISGLVDKNGNEANGLVIGIPMTAHQLLENRKSALKKIINAVKIAKSRGAKYVGLGAMTASLSRGGRDVIDNVSNISVTTGRTYTIKNITEYVETCKRIFRLDKDKVVIGIVGAAGGIGSGVAISLARNGYKRFVLIDLERKLNSIKDGINKIEHYADNLDIQTSHRIKSIESCQIVIAATSSPEIVIESRDVNPGTIIINDAQPSDISPEIIRNRSDVLVIEGGVLHSEKIDCHFDFGLSHRNDIFSCLAETLILAYTNSTSHYSIEDFDHNFYTNLEKYRIELGFSICFQNDMGIIDEKRLKEFDTIMMNRNYT